MKNTEVEPYILAEQIMHQLREKQLKNITYEKFEEVVDYLTQKAFETFTNNTTWRELFFKSKDRKEFTKTHMYHWAQSYLKLKV